MLAEDFQPDYVVNRRPNITRTLGRFNNRPS